MQVPGADDVIDALGVHHVGTVPRVHLDGTSAGADYTKPEIVAALITHRVQTFRYEQHRLVGGTWSDADQRVNGGAWTVIADISDKIVAETLMLKHDYYGSGFNDTFECDIVDDAGTINFVTDVIRVFWLLKMPDGNYAAWMLFSGHIPAPKTPLKIPWIHHVETHDATETLAAVKLSDWLKIPSPPPGGGFDDGDPLNWAIHLIHDKYPLAGVDITLPTSIRVGDDPPPAPARHRAKIYQIATAYLDLLNSLMLFCNYEFVHTDPTGSFIAHAFVLPSARTSEWTYTADGDSIIVQESGVKELDLYNAPNDFLRYVMRPDAIMLRSRLTLNGTYDPFGTNPLSTVSRGRQVTDAQAIDAPDQATLDTVVQRLFEDGQRLIAKLTIKAPLMPHGYYDKITVTYPSDPNFPWSALVTGDYFVTGWTIRYEEHAPISELTCESAPLTVAGTPSH
jgi:hypothetical protein